MITQLAPLGATHRLSFVPEYDGQGNVTLSVMYAPKSDKEAVPRSLTISGTLAEVEAAVAADLAAAINKLAVHTSTLAALDAELAAEKKKKAETERKAKAKAAPATKKAPPPPPAEPKETSVPLAAGALTPAWKKAPAAAAVVEEDDEANIEALLEDV